MLWFLRLFSRFRFLESALTQMQADYQSMSGSHGAKARLEVELTKSCNIVSELRNDLRVAESANAALQQENLRLQDRLEAAAEDRKQLWDTMQQALANERASYQMQVNEEWQKRYGVTPYPEAPHIPTTMANSEDRTGTFGRRGRMLPSEMQAAATQAFWDKKAAKAAQAAPAV
jgi:regulator of replication initiation timing